MKAVIVLGAAVWPDGQPSPTLRRRAEWGARVFRTDAADLVIASGGLGRHPPSEAEVIRRILIDHGVPPDRILREDRSTNTDQNLRFSTTLPGARDVTRWIVVSDHYHATRIRLIAARLGLTVETSSPPLTGTARWRVVKSYLREVFAVANELRKRVWINGRR